MVSWPQALRDRQPEPWQRCARSLRVRERTCIIQFFFEHQWCRLKRYANGRGMNSLGPLVSEDSVDVWGTANSSFWVTAVDHLTLPEHRNNFSTTGQLWSSPLYDWR